MSRSAHRSPSLPRARTEPDPGWLLLWIPLLVIVFDGSSDLSAALIRLAAVLLLGMLIWGMGRGPAGTLAELGLAAMLLVGWFAVCGTAFRLLGPSDSIPARLGVAAGLLVGPAFLLWAWRRRARMAPVLDGGGGIARRGAAATLARAMVFVGAALFMAHRLLGLRQADLLVVGTGLFLGTAFSVRGRRRGFGVLG